ncbi:hypothetical protein LBMAG48_16740 [Phycisphaerae bacterium]|nr:hypothetical protein LBMAG48_16740 [Phycisphaerae bacterium]
MLDWVIPELVSVSERGAHMQGHINHNFRNYRLPMASRHESLGVNDRGFTIIEILFAILIIGVIMGLLIISVQSARKSTRTAVDANALREIGKAIERFQDEFKFVVPLVAEQRDLTADTAGGWNAIVPLANPKNTIRVIDRGDLAGLNFLRGDGAVTAPTAALPFGENSNGPNANNASAGFDKRFSTLSLGYYLAGGLDSVYGAGITGVPIDGVKGPGFYTPLIDGSFEVPEAVRRAAANERKQVGSQFQPFVSVNGAFRLFVDSGASGGRRVELRDGKNAPLRYYLWINEFREPGGTYRAPASIPEMNVPLLVGRYYDPNLTPESSIPGEVNVPGDRDLQKNPGLRGRFMWALVAAGANGVFGDESDAEIAAGLNVSDVVVERTKRRFEAERDNIVVYGEVKR